MRPEHRALLDRVLSGDYVFDIETNGLLKEVSVIHSAVVIDAATAEVWDFEPHEIKVFLGFYLKVIADGGRLIGHNIIGYDVAVIQKLHGVPIPPAAQMIDTVNLAKVIFSDIKQEDFKLAKAWKKFVGLRTTWEAQNPDVRCPYPAPKEFPGQFVGMHSLEAWGYRLGTERKGDYSKEMKAQGLDPWASWNPAMHDYMIQDGRVNLALYRYLMDQGPSPQAILIEMRVQRLCSQIERNGWPFNVKAAEELYSTLCAERESLAQSLRSLFPPWVVQLDDFIPARNNKTKGYVKGVPVERFETIEFNPASRDHIADRLKAKYGWEPVEFTDGGKAKIDDDVLTGLPFDEAKQLARFFLIQKRIGQLGEGSKAWLRLVTSEGKIHGRYNTNGAVTGRATHYDPNKSQVPGVGAEFGRDCRALFTVPKGWKQLGADQAGLELRCLGSFLAAFDGGAYIQVVLHGDVHWENAKALFGLPEGTERCVDESHPDYKPHKKMRDVAKTFIYAFLYGAGPEKLGSIPGVTDAEAAHWSQDPKHRAAIIGARNRFIKWNGHAPTKQQLRHIYKGMLLTDQFLKAFPALKDLLKVVKSAAKKKWLKGLDGRRIPVRSDHAALNSLLQSAGAVICKQWICDVEDALIAAGFKHGWDGDFVFMGFIHDEIQLAVREGLEDAISPIVIEAARRAGDPFSTWKCPTDGDVKIGNNWAECH